MVRITIAVIATIALCAAAALANTERHVALEFANYRVGPLNEFKTAKACQAFVAAQRKQAEHRSPYPHQPFYGCDSGSEMAGYVKRVFGAKAAELFQ